MLLFIFCFFLSLREDVGRRSLCNVPCWLLFVAAYGLLFVVAGLQGFRCVSLLVRVVCCSLFVARCSLFAV